MRMSYYGSYNLIYILLLAAIVFSMWASHHVNSVFKKYSSDYNRRRITGAEAARRVLNSRGLYGVAINRIPGNLSDHYDPSANCLNLSAGVYDSTSTAAIGVACHEAGHAIQYAEGYFPIKIRSAVIPATNIGSKLAFPLILAGALLSGLSGMFYNLIYVGIACFSLSVVFQLITLPVEFNASGRALACIEQAELLTADELPHARRVLSAAAMTYVAALAVAIMQLLRLLAIYGRKRR